MKNESSVSFLTEPYEGRSTFRSTNVLVYGWVGGKHVCVDLLRFLHRWNRRLVVLLWHRQLSKLLLVKWSHMRKCVPTINMFSYYLPLTIAVS